jgi:hypothetical protein
MAETNPPATSPPKMLLFAVSRHLLRPVAHRYCTHRCGHRPLHLWVWTPNSIALIDVDTERAAMSGGDCRRPFQMVCPTLHIGLRLHWNCPEGWESGTLLGMTLARRVFGEVEGEQPHDMLAISQLTIKSSIFILDSRRPVSAAPKPLSALTGARSLAKVEPSIGMNGPSGAGSSQWAV